MHTFTVIPASVDTSLVFFFQRISTDDELQVSTLTADSIIPAQVKQVL